jgi:hypothetical protein
MRADDDSLQEYSPQRVGEAMELPLRARLNAIIWPRYNFSQGKSRICTTEKGTIHRMDETSRAILTVSGVLFGFLFAAFWWILNRELRFKPEQRHFKPATAILMASMAMLATFGIIIPLRHAAQADPTLLTSYHGILLALLAVYGYMLTELGHYRIYQAPKYTTSSEKVFFTLTLVVVIGLGVKWWFFC